LMIENGEWVEVRSRRGTGRFPVLVTSAINRGTVFVPMHWGELWAKDAAANTFTHSAACPDSLQPELKACAVQLVPVKFIGLVAAKQAVQLERQGSSIGV
jgi:ferredoxin-nitrate reductase